MPHALHWGENNLLAYAAHNAVLVYEPEVSCDGEGLQWCRHCCLTAATPAAKPPARAARTLLRPSCNYDGHVTIMGTCN